MNDGEYQFLVEGIIPATQEAFRGGRFYNGIRKKEKNCVKIFKKVVSDYLLNDKPSSLFPTNNQVYVSVVQFYTSYKKDYNKRDVDNIAKTILDILKENNFYKDDCQVRTLLVSKIVDLKRIRQNIGFIFIKVLNDNEDIAVVNNMIPRAVKLYEDLKEGRINSQ